MTRSDETALKGKVACVTGGHRRIGLAISKELARCGMDVAVIYHKNQEAAQAACETLRQQGVKSLAIQADLADQGSLEQALKTLKKEFLPVDLLVNNAATFPQTEIGSVTPEIWDRVMHTNLRAAFFLSQALGLEMKKRGHGKIINMVDCFDNRPYVDFLPYCVSKTGLLTLTQGFAKALAPEVQVNAIHPGWVMPPENGEDSLDRSLSKVPLGRFGQAEDVARMVRFLAEEADYSTGASFFIDGGRNIQ